MTKTFCDRCKKEITQDMSLIKVDVSFRRTSNYVNIANNIDDTYDICGNCYNELERFLDGYELRDPFMFERSKYE